jgi:hypothetical protein
LEVFRKPVLKIFFVEEKFSLPVPNLVSPSITLSSLLLFTPFYNKDLTYILPVSINSELYKTEEKAIEPNGESEMLLPETKWLTRVQI